MPVGVGSGPSHPLFVFQTLTCFGLYAILQLQVGMRKGKLEYFPKTQYVLRLLDPAKSRSSFNELASLAFCFIYL